MNWNIKVENKEQFKEVLDFFRAQGKDIRNYHNDYFYPFMSIGEGSSRDWSYNATDTDVHSTTYPLDKRITWEQFQQLKNPFPEKWCIRANPDEPSIGAWFNEHSQTCCHIYEKSNAANMLHYPAFADSRGIWHIWKNVMKGYTEITFEQFKNNILKEKLELIGYKCPMDLYDGKVKKDHLYIRNPRLPDYYPETLGNASSLYNIAKEIVETWEPIYKEVIKSQVVELGNPVRTFEIFKDKVRVTGGNGTIRIFNKENIDKFKGVFLGREILNLSISVELINIGCSDGTKLSRAEFQSIIDIQSQL